MPRQVTVGRILGAHGIRGEVVLRRYGDDPGILSPGSTLHAERGGHDMTLTVNRARPHKGGWIVAFEGVANRDEAEVLRGLTLRVGEDALPPLAEGTFYRFQLIGLEVRTAEDEPLGRVDEVMETGANDVLVVKGPRGEILIPAVEPFIAEVDLEAGRIRVETPPGLIPEGDGR